MAAFTRRDVTLRLLFQNSLIAFFPFVYYVLQFFGNQLIALVVCLLFTFSHDGISFDLAGIDQNGIRKWTCPPNLFILLTIELGTLKTSILSGSTFNVTWHLGYPHRGGYRIQVLDSREKPILDLTQGQNNSVFVDGDPTALAYSVTLPKELQCKDCTIRLIRQASEWGKSYMFWSCADVDIISRKLGHPFFIFSK